ncbi:MAG TPA: hypothetical protein VL281_08425 [Mycobacteriales bacterium]|nr:hypothetical protein [Mycobacteriales bacterium]
MRALLLGLVLGVVLTGCSSGEPEDAASPSPTALPTSAPAAVGPTAGGSVPAGAFVSPGDLGTSWHAAPALPTPCAPAYGRTRYGSRGLAEPRGTLTETLATGVDVPAAVAAWRTALRGCGFALGDERLGDASVAAVAKDGSDAVTVTGTEGVLVVLHAHGALARARDDLSAWADLALGTSCVAAPDGCH